MGVYKRIGDRVCYFKNAAEMAAFLNSDQEKKESKKKKKKI